LGSATAELAWISGENAPNPCQFLFGEILEAATWLSRGKSLQSSADPNVTET